MENFKSTELEEMLSTPVQKTESDRELEHNTFREMLASGFQREEEDITVNFGRRTVLGSLENGEYRDEITSSKIDAVMNALAEDPHPEFLSDRTPFIEIKASDEVLLKVEQNGGVTVNKFDISRLFDSEQTAAAQIEADSKLDITQSELDEFQYKLDEIYQAAKQELSGEFWEFDSSVLKSGLYEPDTKELTLEFQTGKDYTYRDIAPDVWEDFKEADSAGRFYNQEIKGQYSVEKVGENLLEDRQDELGWNSIDAELEATKANLEARQQRLDNLASEALEKYQVLDRVEDVALDKSVTVEIPFLSPEAEPQISHPLQEFDTSSLKDFLNQEYQLTDQLTEIHRADAGNQIDYEALKGVVEKAVENIYPEWDEADPDLAEEIKWYRLNDRSRELQISTDLVLAEIDTEARENALALNQEQPSWEALTPPAPIQFQTTDTGGADSHFLDSVQEYIKDETDPRVLTENTGLSPAQVLVNEINLQDPNISGNSQTQQWIYNTAQEINQDVSQIRQDFIEQQQQQALVDEVAPQLVDILNELGTDKLQGKNRTIEFDKEQNQLTLTTNATGAIVMTAQWHPDQEKWENKGSSLTTDDRDQIQEAAQRVQENHKDRER